MAFDIKSAIATIAPTLATMLGGPLAGTAVVALSQALGLKGSSADEVAKALQSATMTPETMAALRAADLKHAEVIGQQGIDLVKINADHQAAMAASEAADRASARQLQMTKPSYWPGILSAVTTLAVLAVIGSSIAGTGLPQDPTTVQLIGSLTTGWGMCLAYWFGTTRSSGEKNALLAQASPPVQKASSTS